jgi:hypothetical protein
MERQREREGGGHGPSSGEKVFFSHNLETNITTRLGLNSDSKVCVQ